MQQAAFEMPVMANATPMSFLDLEVSDHLKETLQLLCKLSGHSYACYISFDYENKKFKEFGGHQGLFADIVFDQFSLIESFQDQPQQVWINTQLKKYLNHHFSSMYALKFNCTQLDDDFFIILFSESEHKVSEETGLYLEHYVKQRETSLELILDNLKLKKKIEEYEELSLSRSKYFSIISHDLRAPFHGIMGCADILVHEQSQLDVDEIHRLSSYIHDTATSTYGLLESLLNWSMAEGGRFHCRPVHFNVSDIIQSVFDLLQAFAFKKQIKLQCDIPSDIYAFADVRMVTSILQNLISNALKFTLDQSSKIIYVTARSNHQWIEIRVQDQGVGMTPDQMSKLFSSHTVPSTQGTSGEKGTGLGLALCKKFLDMNNGQITVESKQGVGTRFIVRLPM